MRPIALVSDPNIQQSDPSSVRQTIVKFNRSLTAVFKKTPFKRCVIYLVDAEVLHQYFLNKNVKRWPQTSSTGSFSKVFKPEGEHLCTILRERSSARIPNEILARASMRPGKFL